MGSYLKIKLTEIDKQEKSIHIYLAYVLHDKGVIVRKRRLEERVRPEVLCKV